MCLKVVGTIDVFLEREARVETGPGGRVGWMGGGASMWGKQGV